jgi:hypothetical protein
VSLVSSEGSVLVSPHDSNFEISILPFSNDLNNNDLESTKLEIQDPTDFNRIVPTEQEQFPNLDSDRANSWRYVRWNKVVVEGNEAATSNRLETSSSRPSPLSKRVFSIDTQFSIDIRSIDDIDFEHAFDSTMNNDIQFPSTISLEFA